MTGTYRTPTAKGHSAKTTTQQQLYLIHRNKQGSSENEETKKHFPNERPEQNSGKRTKQMETSNLPDAEFKTLVIRILNNLSENFNKDENIKMEIENIKETEMNNT